jgi:hypothetical protein
MQSRKSATTSLLMQQVENAQCRIVVLLTKSTSEVWHKVTPGSMGSLLINGEVPVMVQWLVVGFLETNLEPVRGLPCGRRSSHLLAGQLTERSLRETELSDLTGKHIVSQASTLGVFSTPTA